MAANLVCSSCGLDFEAKRSDTRRCPSCATVRRKEYQRQYEHGRKKASCVGCGKVIGARTETQRCVGCKNKYFASQRVGEKNPNWRNGRTQVHGYIYHRVGRGPGQGAYRAEHILVWEQANGPLPRGHIVHHLNGIKDDNRLENLLGVSRRDHYRLHAYEFVVRHYEARIRELEQRVKELEAHRI